MRLLWEEQAWDDYCYWQTQDKRTLKRINALIKDIQRDRFDGIGKPEPLLRSAGIFPEVWDCGIGLLWDSVG